jgi:hypothetical protein
MLAYVRHLGLFLLLRMYVCTVLRSNVELQVVEYRIVQKRNENVKFVRHLPTDSPTLVLGAHRRHYLGDVTFG